MSNNRNDMECVRDAMLFQFDMAWQLLEYHFNGLEDDECLWKPYENGLHVNFKNNVWQADWPTTESYDIGPPSIAWTLWHIIFWWTMTFDHSFGRGELSREVIYWPGSAELAKQRITEFHDKWRSVLETIPVDDFLSTTQVKWPFKDKPFYQLAIWLNLELIKNASEIGVSRFLYAAQKQPAIST